MTNESPFSPEVRRALPLLFATRLLVTTGSRMAYTFLPAFARGTGLSLGEMGALIGFRDVASLGAPYVGRLSDRRGAARLMTIGLALAGLGLVLAAFGAVGLAVGFFIFAIGRLLLNVPMSAWIAHEVAYERRGRATGLLEMSYAGAALIGMPLLGLLIDLVGWWAAPTAVGLLAVAFVPLLARLQRKASSADTGRERVRPTMNRTAIATLATIALMTAASHFLVFGHGTWLEETYGFDAKRVGFAILLVGVAEAIASFGSSRLTDGLGKRQSILIGTTLMLAAAVGLWLFSTPPLVAGLAFLIVAFLGFEFGIVSSLPLIAELDPLARAEMIGRAAATTTLVRAAGSPLAAFIQSRSGFSALMVASIITAIAAIACAALFVDEPNPEPEVTSTSASDAVT